MKKKLCILLAITLITINLAACGKEEKQNVITLSPEVLQEAPPAVTPETPPLEIEPTVATDTAPETETPGESIEIIPSDKPAAEGEFGTSEDFSGIYAIRGYSSFSFNGKRSLDLMLKGIDNNNEGNFNASATSIPDYILDYTDYIYLNLVFDNSGLVSWSIIDKIDLVDLGQATVEQIEKLSPDGRYEKVSVGLLPGTIFLSEYEVNKMYVFDLPADADQGFMPPEIFNDSDKTVLIVSTRVGAEEHFEDEWKCNLYVRKNAFGFSSADEADDKYYLIIRESSVEQALNEVDYLNLSTCTKGELIDYSFEDFLYNDTDKVFTISCGEDTCVINPGQLVECSWMNDVMVDNIE